MQCNLLYLRLVHARTASAHSAARGSRQSRERQRPEAAARPWGQPGVSYVPISPISPGVCSRGVQLRLKKSITTHYIKQAKTTHTHTKHKAQSTIKAPGAYLYLYLI
jgi:hypothetical protein